MRRRAEGAYDLHEKSWNVRKKKVRTAYRDDVSCIWLGLQISAPFCASPE